MLLCTTDLTAKQSPVTTAADLTIWRKRIYGEVQGGESSELSRGLCTCEHVDMEVVYFNMPIHKPSKYNADKKNEVVGSYTNVQKNPAEGILDWGTHLRLSYWEANF